jgi:hypothetical protein
MDDWWRRRCPTWCVFTATTAVAAIDSSSSSLASWPWIDRNTVVKSRVREGNQWSALNEAFFQASPAALKAGEVGITAMSFDQEEDTEAEFVEVSNVSSQAINLRGAHFTEGIGYAFAETRDTILAPGQMLTLVKDLFRFRQHRGLEIGVEGIYSRKEKKRAGPITLSLKSGEVITSRSIDGTDSSRKR